MIVLRSNMPFFELHRRILIMWRAGSDTYDIAKRLKVSEASVYNYLAKHKGAMNGSHS